MPGEAAQSVEFRCSAHSCNPSTGEMEAGEPGGSSSPPQLHRELEARLDDEALSPEIHSRALNTVNDEVLHILNC